MNTVRELNTSKGAYKIFYDNAAFRWLEEKTGKGFAALKYDSINEITLLLWASLLRHQPDTTIHTADEIIDDLGHEAVLEVLTEAFEDSPPFRRRPANK